MKAFFRVIKRFYDSTTHYHVEQLAKQLVVMAEKLEEEHRTHTTFLAHDKQQVEIFTAGRVFQHNEMLRTLERMAGPIPLPAKLDVAQIVKKAKP